MQALIPATVHDKSKVISDGGKDAIYQKQGTYQCQVKEFGAVEVVTSNAIIVTYHRVLNGVVSISLSNLTKSVLNVDAVMGSVRDFIHEVLTVDGIPKLVYLIKYLYLSLLQNVLGDVLKVNQVKTSWDPLYSVPLRSGGLEYRYSLYIDIATQYPVRVIS